MQAPPRPRGRDAAAAAVIVIVVVVSVTSNAAPLGRPLTCENEKRPVGEATAAAAEKTRAQRRQPQGGRERKGIDPRPGSAPAAGAVNHHALAVTRGRVPVPSPGLCVWRRDTQSKREGGKQLLLFNRLFLFLNNFLFLGEAHPVGFF